MEEKKIPFREAIKEAWRESKSICAQISAVI
jgi:hypothetical protein